MTDPIELPSKRGHYRLKRQKGGIGYFGEVTVAVGAATKPIRNQAVWAVDPADTSSIQPRLDPELVDAALRGAEDGLGLLSRIGVDVSNLVVHITHVQLDLTDIEETAVRTAAALAVAGSHAPPGRFSAEYDGGWRAVVRPL
ncbi:hypothetical protein [Nocardia suismassiliense]|uniref:hypothetical protein n=1 Tax=Nocardia suismassiliense TaxID=2077092 RepID=UPI000D1DDCD6|nr:hypothetical protein [Nocardia suismassiliense]